MEEYTKKCFALIIHQRGETGGGAHRRKKARWLVLKSPQNSELYEEMARVFPNAVFVFTHRQPREFLSSMVGMATYTFLVSNDASYGGRADANARGEHEREGGSAWRREGVPRHVGRDSRIHRDRARETVQRRG